MPTINLSAIVRLDAAMLYETMKDIEAFPNFMRKIKHIKTIRKLSHNRLIREWAVEVDSEIVTWKEEEGFDNKNKIVKFKMLSGDYKKYEGTWRIDVVSSGSRISVFLKVDWGIPVLEKGVGKIIERKMRANLKSMLKAIIKKAQSS